MSSKKKKKLPALISIPHGGTMVPPELKGRTRIGRADILEDGDAFTREIYEASDWVEVQLAAEVARAFVDLNRAEDDLPPGNPDGVIKSHTSFLRRVYKKGQEPDENLVELLLERYHRPYHRRIKEILDSQPAGLKLGLDCHSMAAVGPDIAPDSGRRRPAICLGNLNGKSCSQETIDSLATCFRLVFGLDDKDITQNRPFAGGYITRSYSQETVPWIQVEMSRDLYLRKPWFELESLEADPERLRELNSMFKEVLLLFFGA